VSVYRFLTTWVLEAPRDRVFQAIWDSERWPSWWHGVESVETLEDGDDEGVGSVGRYVWKSRLPYRLEFDMQITKVDRPYLMEGTSTGELAGTGRWRLFEEAGVTAVVYEWDVSTTARWMNLLAPLARPVFAWNHDAVMRWGGEGLARLLGARLLAIG
jgi:uncharacterized protein YndB with AHSA1/START domain